MARQLRSAPDVSSPLAPPPAAEERRAPSSLTELWRRARLGIASVVGLISIWALLTETGIIDTFILPSPMQMGNRFVELARDGYANHSLWSHIGVSMFRAMSGFAFALLVGIPLGLIMGYKKLVGELLTPLFGLLRPIPAIAFIPLAVLYFGIGEASKIWLIFFTATLYVVLNTEAGVRQAPRDLVMTARNLGAGQFEVLRFVILPAALPHIFVGVRTATALAWALVVAAELVSAQQGLGFMVMSAATFFRIPDVYVSIALIGTFGLILETATRTVEKRMLHWQGR